MTAANSIVVAILKSPAHRLLSGTVDVIRYRGQRSGQEHVTPTQYVEQGGDLLIFVARPETKSWWRNFRTDRDVEVLVRGRWQAMRARAVVGKDEPETMVPLLDGYLKRFPKVAKALEGESGDDRARHAVMLVCQPR